MPRVISAWNIMGIWLVVRSWWKSKFVLELPILLFSLSPPPALKSRRVCISMPADQGPINKSFKLRGNNVPKMKHS